MSQGNLEGLLNCSLEKLKGLVDVNTIIGEPITAPDGTIIVPVSKVAFGYGSGGSDFGGDKPKLDRSYRTKAKNIHGYEQYIDLKLHGLSALFLKKNPEKPKIEPTKKTEKKAEPKKSAAKNNKSTKKSK